jgi:hypothetical protein
VGIDVESGQEIVSENVGVVRLGMRSWAKEDPMKKWSTFVVVALTAAASVSFAGGASSAGAACSVLLQVDVFGSGSRSWALHGGLDAGKSATLQATTRGCHDGLDHITGRWASGGTGRFPGTPTTCPGAICQMHVRSDTMSSADFQAVARTAGGFAKSNIVRVAWAGEKIEGSYTTHFRTDPPGTAQVEVSGNDVSVTNERGETATGTYDPAARELILTAGWPDISPGTPFIGRVSGSAGHLRIDWPTLKDGGSGGFWTHD